MKKNLLPVFLLFLFCAANLFTGCSGAKPNRYFGKTTPPEQNILRYVSGPEPESLDPQISSGQPEARIYMALFEGLVEYDPKDMSPIPAIAEKWETSPQIDEFIFHLRPDARWSDGTPITARDFIYSFRRGFSPETLSRTASMGYYIKYAEAYNRKAVFVRKNGEYLLAKDFQISDAGQKAEERKAEIIKPFGQETAFRKFIKSPERLTLSGDEKERIKQIEADPQLAAAVQGADFVPVEDKDIGIEAVDDYTVRIFLRQPVPFFIKLLAHQFFRLVPQQAIEKYGKNWTRPENIVTCGPFKLKEHSPYDKLIVEKDPNYWDAGKVRLDEIRFYPVEEQSTILNLYKAGEIDATTNHSVPASWVDEIRQYKNEYLEFPEAAIAFFSINTKAPPMDNIKVRRAFNLALDRESLAKFRRTTQPLYNFTPAGIFPDYERAREKNKLNIQANLNFAPDKEAISFNPAEARKLLAEAGYEAIPLGDGSNNFTCPGFPTGDVSITYNTFESNRQIAEFVQAQWRQNLGVTVPLKSLEFRSFLALKNSLQFKGFAITNYSGDYMDPFTFLSLQYTEQNDGATGWWDAGYDQMIDKANLELDPVKRNEELSRAESYFMKQQVIVPLQTTSTNWLKKPYVKEMYPNPGTLHPWKFIYIERDPNKWDENVSEIMK